MRPLARPRGERTFLLDEEEPSQRVPASTKRVMETLASRVGFNNSLILLAVGGSNLAVYS